MSTSMVGTRVGRYVVGLKPKKRELILNFSTFLMLGLALLAGLVAGAGLYAMWLLKKEDTDPPIPAKWPLAARGIMSGEEHEVMKWLRSTFPEHMIMVKMPVVRYTIPVGKDKKAESKRLQDLIDGVYCSFAVCTISGTVVGCIDVPGKRGLPRGNRDLKESLLSDCGIAYTVVRGFDLPRSSAMRAAFLGELEVEDKPEHQETRGGDSSFHADLDAFTAKARRDEIGRAHV